MISYSCDLSAKADYRPYEPLVNISDKHKGQSSRSQIYKPPI